MSNRAQERVGRVLRDKWRLDQLLGAGGMASVYSATHRNGTRAAVKLLHPELSLNNDIKQRFLREGYLANSIDHPGIVRVFDDDTDTADGSVYLVMDLLVGETLDSRWRKHNKRMPLEEAMRIGMSLLDVLAAAHAKGIVHRDIKPENIFLTEKGGLRVLDFGIARIREAAQENATQTGALLGTPSYMSPEQARGQWDEVDGRTDLWAVGATLYTLLSGRPPHIGNGGNAVLLAAMTQQAAPLASVAPDVPHQVCAVIDRALAFDRNQRWPDAKAMQQALMSSTIMSGFAPTMMLSVQELPRASQTGPHPSHTGPYPSQTGPHPSHTGPQPNQSGQHPSIAGQSIHQVSMPGVVQTVDGSIPGLPPSRRWVIPVVLGCAIAGAGIVLATIAIIKNIKPAVAPTDSVATMATPPPPASSEAQVLVPPTPTPVLPSASQGAPSASWGVTVKSGTAPTVVHHASSSTVSSGRLTPSVTTTPTPTGDIHDSRK